MRADPPALPQGPSLRSGLFCPDPSTLNRPHPPLLQARRDFPALLVIPDAFAVPCGQATRKRFRAFTVCSLAACHTLRPRGSVGCIHPVHSSPTALAFARVGRARHLSRFRFPNSPPSVSCGGRLFRGFYVSHLLRPVELLAPLTDQTGFPRVDSHCPLNSRAGVPRFPSLRGLLHPGFRQVGHPPCRWI